MGPAALGVVTKYVVVIGTVGRFGADMDGDIRQLGHLVKQAVRGRRENYRTGPYSEAD